MATQVRDRSRRTLQVVLAASVLLGGCAAAHAPEVELEQIVDALQLQPGMRVADVGAGDGEWSEALAQRVGAAGHVFATEVDEDDLDGIRRRIDKAGLENVSALLGDALKTGLPEDCCDAILLRLVYHHFTDPERMRAQLDQALRPGGRLVVVEITPQTHWADLDGVPDRGGHGIDPEDLLAEMRAGGWVDVERHDDWGEEQDHYCVVFEVGPPKDASTP